MKTQALTVTFIILAIMSLIVSTVAVFVTARVYNDGLPTFNSNNEQTNPSPSDKINSDSDTSSSSSANGEQADNETSVTDTPSDENDSSSNPNDTSDSTASSASDTEIDPDNEPQSPSGDSTPVGGTSENDTCVLILKNGKLIIKQGNETLYERSFSSTINKKEQELLLGGIEFDNEESAMSAIYDLIS